MSDRMQMASHRFTLTGELYDDGKNWISFENDITELPSIVRRSVARRLRTPELKPNYRRDGLATPVEPAAQRPTTWVCQEFGVTDCVGSTFGLRTGVLRR